MAKESYNIGVLLCSSVRKLFAIAGCIAFIFVNNGSRWVQTFIAIISVLLPHTDPSSLQHMFVWRFSAKHLNAIDKEVFNIRGP